MKPISNLCFIFIILCGCVHKAHLQPMQEPKKVELKYLTGSQVVMIAHPFCHFSEQAFKDFSEEFKRNFKAMIVIAPVSSRHFEEESKAIDDWNSKNDVFQMIKVRDDSLLSSIDLTQTPQFYFFKDGVVKKKIVGWPRDKSNLKLLSEAAVESSTGSKP